MICKIISGTSKKGKEYKALKINIGEYETVLFPTKIELLYIEDYLKKQAHNDFQEGLTDEH